jgi:uncharacterized membrane protein YccC
MLAFWIACALDLSRPTWAIFTVYVLMQPISGAVRSKATYRMIGTLGGAALALLLASCLADHPLALFLALGFVAIAGYFIALMDRMPRSYIFLMAGITAAVIGMPNTFDPLTIFDTAMTRTEEVLLGIICAVAVDSAISPHPAGEALNARVAAWLADARTYLLDALQAGSPNHETAHSALLAKLAADASQLDALASHVGYDSVPVRPNKRVVRLLHTRMLLMIRLMFAARDWATAVRADLPETESVADATAAVRDWFAAAPAATPAQEAAVAAAIARLQAEPNTAANPSATLRGALGEVLRNLMSGSGDCLALQRAVAQGTPLPDSLRRAARQETLSIPYRDPLRTLLVLLPTTVGFLLVVSYWSATAWDQGPTAALMALVAGAFAGSAEQPAARTLLVAVVVAVAFAVAIVLLFAVLPAAQDFPVVAAALGLFFLPVGAFIPITQVTGQLLAAMTAMALSLQPEYDAQFGTVLDGALGTLAGLAATALLAQIIETPGIAWTTRRLLRVGWADLAALADGRWRPTQAGYTMRALGRYTELAPRLDLPGGDPDLTTAAQMGELRIGVNILLLRGVMPALPADARDAAEAMLQTITRHFAARRRDAPPMPVSVLRERGTTAMAAAAAAMPGTAAQTAWLMLAGMQRSLVGTAAWHEISEAPDAR